MDTGDVDVTARGDVDKLKGNAVGLYSILFLCVTGSAPLAVFIYNTPFTMPLRVGQRRARRPSSSRRSCSRSSRSRTPRWPRRCAPPAACTPTSATASGRAWGVMAGYSLMIGYTIFGVALIGGFSSFLQAKLAAVRLARQLAVARADRRGARRLAGLLRRGDLGEGAGRRADQRDHDHHDRVDRFFWHGKDVSVAPILPWNGLTTGIAPGVGVFFAFWSWVGFEAAPNYAEEAKDPVRVIPIALIFSCVAVGAALHVHVVGARLGLRHGHRLGERRQRGQHGRDQRQDGAGRLRQLRARAGLGHCG